jgi:hypothetical protein
VEDLFPLPKNKEIPQIEQISFKKLKPTEVMASVIKDAEVPAAESS